MSDGIEACQCNDVTMNSNVTKLSYILIYVTMVEWGRIVFFSFPLPRYFTLVVANGRRIERLVCPFVMFQKEQKNFGRALIR